MRLVVVILILAGAAFITALHAATGPQKPTTQPTSRPWVEPRPPTTGPDTQPVRLRTIDELQPVIGYAINAHHIGNLDLYLQSVDRIVEMGANSLVLVTPMWMSKVDSSSIKRLQSKCPTDAQLHAILERAKAHGLHTTLIPIVLIEHPGKKDWRGVIKPKSWDAWWESYGRMMDRFISIAVHADVDMLSIGSELNSTERQEERWRAVVDRVRERFEGQLTYSSNWDRFHKMRLWPLVDVISVSSYFELERANPGAPEDRIVQAWAPIRSTLIDFARREGKPLMMSELGYPSLPWANAHPWNYVPEDDTETDHEMQARCFRAFFRAWTETLADPDSPVVGFSCYHWDPYHHGEDYDTGYGVDGKPADEVIRRGFAEIKRLASERRD